MQRAFELAEMGRGYTKPNPMVGAVIVENDTIIGEGYHEAYGGAHAEVNALKDAEGKMHHATMYVTLEPCNHTGKTPPCSLAIVNAPIARVVIASKDPNPVAHGGIDTLKKHGIEVSIGLLHEENVRINYAFFHYATTKTPFITLKTAMSADGKIATKTHDSKWISNEKSRRYVHELRHEYHAIMVGANTVIKDDPKLTARLEEQNTINPIRIVLDSDGIIPLDANILNTEDAPTIIVASAALDDSVKKAYEARGAEVLTVTAHDGLLSIEDVVNVLGESGIQSILLEGGASVNDAFMRAGVIKRYYNFIAPKLIGGRDALTPISGEGVNTVGDALNMQMMDVKRFDGDVCIIYELEGRHVHRHH